MRHRDSDKREPEVFIGSSAWTEKTLVGKLYPTGALPKEFLGLYSRQFHAIELNSTYYAVDPQAIERWVEAVPDDFRFCPKFPQEISHRKQLRGCADDVRGFSMSVRAFGRKLGPSWLLLPENFGPERIELLLEVIDAWPSDLPSAIELRDPRWFSRSPESVRLRDELFGALDRKGAGAVLTDVAGRRDVLHQRLTTSFAFLGLAGNGLDPSDFARVDAWVERTRAWLDAGLRAVFVFVHQEHEGLVADLGEYVKQRLSEALGRDLRGPTPVQRDFLDRCV